MFEEGNDVPTNIYMTTPDNTSTTRLFLRTSSNSQSNTYRLTSYLLTSITHIVDLKFSAFVPFSSFWVDDNVNSVSADVYTQRLVLHLER